ncbi:putative uncharacterized protein [Succinatimonas sp. CAG:777]|jgi:hypothetical protein|nr:putative uncharacterized protein [Succinatimonas sp. CAG:777]
MFTNFATGAQPINHQPNEMANYGQTNNAFQPQLQAQPQPQVKPQLQAQPQIVSDEEKKLDLQSPFAKVKSDFAFNSKANKTETDSIDMTSASNGFTKLPTDFEGAREYAKYISSSQLVPAAMRSTPDCDRSADTFLIIQKGNRLGLLPADALQMIYILGGRTSMSVKAKAGICRKYGTWTTTFDGLNATAKVEGYRFDRPNQKESFTYTGTDAAIAGKMEKDTNGVWVGTQATWKTMWPDMLRARALSHFLDQVFPDVVGGFVDETYDLDIENDTKTATGNKEKAEQLIKKARSKKSTVQTASKEMPSLVIKHEEPKVTAVQNPDTVAPDTNGEPPF